MRERTAGWTDHGIVQRTQQNIGKRGVRFWKFNTSLPEDKLYTESVKDVIKTSWEVNKKCNQSMLWDILKMKIRAITITYRAKLKLVK